MKNVIWVPKWCRFCQNDSPDSMIRRGQIPWSMIQKTQALKSCRKRFSLKRPPGESGLTKRIGVSVEGTTWTTRCQVLVADFLRWKTQGEFCYVNYITRKKIDQSGDICKAWWPKVRDFRFWFYSTWDGYLKSTAHRYFTTWLNERTNSSRTLTDRTDDPVLSVKKNAHIHGWKDDRNIQKSVPLSFFPI